MSQNLSQIYPIKLKNFENEFWGKSIYNFSKILENTSNDLKSAISRYKSLNSFDPRKPTKITCDASFSGLGATIEQKLSDTWEPIAFASHTMNPTEISCFQLGEETLSIVFACTKFHEYLDGRTFLIESDHKPLKVILTKPISQAPPRIQV